MVIFGYASLYRMMWTWKNPSIVIESKSVLAWAGEEVDWSITDKRKHVIFRVLLC